MADSQARQVRRYVETLSRDDRYIVMLYYADGLTPIEISRVLDLPSTQVRTRLDELKTKLALLADATPMGTAQELPSTGPTITAYA